MLNTLAVLLRSIERRPNFLLIIFVRFLVLQRLEDILVSQIKYSLVVILELNGVSEVQYKDVMMIDDGKYQ